MRNQGSGDKWVVLIGAVKLFKGIVLIAFAIGVFKLLHQDLADLLTRWADLLNLDPRNQALQKALEKIAGLDLRKLSLIGVATFAYAGVFVTEGIGLILKQRWAEYLTVIVTASFLPLEIYELSKEFHVTRLIILLLNAAIVVYLIWRLRCKKRKRT